MTIRRKIRRRKRRRKMVNVNLKVHGISLKTISAEPLQPASPPQIAPNPTPPPARHAVTNPPPNPVAAVPPSSTPMPAPRTANPPPSSRAAGKQPMSYAPTTATTNSTPLNNPPRSARAAAKAPAPPQNYNAHNHPHHHPSPPSSNASVPQKHRPPANAQAAPVPKTNNKIWSTNTSEERERIKEFWLGLGEEDRRALVKVEKETVLKKMKEQQKHSCTCAVCGRKRCVFRFCSKMSKSSADNVILFLWATFARHHDL